MFTVDVNYIDVYRCVIPFPNILNFRLKRLKLWLVVLDFFILESLKGPAWDFMRMMGSCFIDHRGDDMGIPHLH